MSLAVTAALIAKKAVHLLLSSEKGRKLILYTALDCIILVLVPVITVFGMVGALTEDNAYEDTVHVYEMAAPEFETELSRIDTHLRALELDNNTINKAKFIYLFYLSDYHRNSFSFSYESFYESYANCFLLSESETVYEELFNAYEISFSFVDISFIENAFQEEQK